MDSSVGLSSPTPCTVHIFLGVVVVLIVFVKAAATNIPTSFFRKFRILDIKHHIICLEMSARIGMLSVWDR